MSKFCVNCGAQMDDSANFCVKCGTPAQKTPTERVEQPLQAAQNASYAPGYSNRVNDPEILAAVKKNRKAAGVFAFILVPLPLIGFLIFSAVTSAIEFGNAFLIGGLVSLVFLIFAVYGLVKNKTEKPYDAVVVDKKDEWNYGKRNTDGERESVHEFITIVKTTDGRTKRIVERDGSRIMAYSYLEVGDRFRYHPQFNFPYELYDKSKAPYIPCVNCGTKNPTGADRCSKCNLPLLK